MYMTNTVGLGALFKADVSIESRLRQFIKSNHSHKISDLAGVNGENN